MAKAYTPDKVFNGTWGQIWLDNTLLPQATALEAKVTLDKSEVDQCMTLQKGYKITGTDGKGTLKMNKIDSTFINLLAADMQNGTVSSHSIISSVSDPSALGPEKVQFDGVVFDELTLADWEAKKLQEESIPFTFTSYTILSAVANS